MVVEKLISAYQVDDLVAKCVLSYEPLLNRWNNYDIQVMYVARKHTRFLDGAVLMLPIRMELWILHVVSQPYLGGLTR